MFGVVWGRHKGSLGPVGGVLRAVGRQIGGGRRALTKPDLITRTRMKADPMAGKQNVHSALVAKMLVLAGLDL